ncbi:MAG: transposase, partial [Oceanidesulfovibrio sp.]
MNALCIQMTNSGPRAGSKKLRKKTLRKMKRLVNTVCEHGERHLLRLEKAWGTTELSCAQKDHIAKRLRNLLGLKTRVIKQAHERIIGERPVKNDEKLLSLYEQHASVYVRGKAGAECEFGLQCLVAESVDGLIMDWDVPGDQIAADSKSLLPSIERMLAAYGEGAIKTAITDRGFTSRANSKQLAELGIEDCTLPRDPQELNRRMRNPKFANLHRRRAQTEARIGIFKNCFVRRTVPAKGLDNQRIHIAWAVLAHNLWVIARIIETTRTQQNAAA